LGTFQKLVAIENRQPDMAGDALAAMEDLEVGRDATDLHGLVAAIVANKVIMLGRRQ